LVIGTVSIRTIAHGAPPRETHMTTYSPEFSAYWQSGPSGPRDALPAANRDSDELAPEQSLSTEQEFALEELAERVFAARSVV
jgi:hypothetical protein